MKNKIKIITVDDHQPINDYIRVLLEGNTAIDVLENFKSPDNALKFMQHNEVDIVISDLSFGEHSKIDGINFTFKIKELFPNLKVIIYTGTNDPQTIRDTVNVGASGFVSKEEDPKELVDAIQSIMLSSAFYCTSKNLKKAFKTDDEVFIIEDVLNNKRITKQEFNVLILIAKDEYTKAEIADKLNLSINTLKSHKDNLKKKLNVKSDIGLANFVSRHGLISSKLF